MAEPGSSQFIETLRALLAAAQAGQIPGAITPAASPSAIPAPAPAPAPAAAPEPSTPAPRPAAQQQQQPPSLLQQLRERATRELAGVPAQQEDPRTAFGRGVLSNRGSFLDNLSAGLQAQREAETAQQTALAAQREEMRRIAQLESEERARREAADYQRRSLELRQQEAARAGRPRFTELTDAQGNVVFIDPETGRRVATDLRPTRDPASRAEENIRRAASSRAATRLNNEIRSSLTAISPADQERRRRELEREELALYGLEPLTGAGAAGSAPAPDRILTFTPTAPSAARTGPRIAPPQQQ